MKLNPYIVGVLVFLAAIAAQKRDLLPDWIPTPIVAESPIKADGLHVLVVAETSAQLPADQQTILTDPKWQTYVEGKGGNYRVFDPDQKFTDDAGVWAVAMKRPRASLPWVVVSNKGGFEGPLPTTPAAMLDLVKEWGE